MLECVDSVRRGGFGFFKVLETCVEGDVVMVLSGLLVAFFK